jgi:hypothetical protein
VPWSMQTMSVLTPPRPGPCQLRLATHGDSPSPSHTRAFGTARGLDIISSLCAEAYAQDLRLRRHQQHTRKRRGDPNNARELDNNLAPDRGCDSTATIHLSLQPRPHRSFIGLSLSASLSASTASKRLPYINLDRADHYINFNCANHAGLILKAKCFSIKSQFLFYFHDTRYSEASLCKLTLQVVDYAPSPRRLRSATSTTRSPRQLRPAVSNTSLRHVDSGPPR